MDDEVVQDHHVAGLQRRGQLGLDVDVEGRAIHGPVQHPGCGQRPAPQARDEGLGSPVAERSVGDQARSAQASGNHPLGGDG